MEEARQHPALTKEQWLFRAIYHCGSLVLVVSICLQIFWRIDALFPAIMIVGVSRIGLAAWQTGHLDSSNIDRTRSGLVMNIIVWGSVMVLLLWARLYGAGT